MEIVITDKVREYLKEKRKRFVIISLYEQLCWGGRKTSSVVVSTAEDFTKKGYEKYIVDKYEVYIDKKLKCPNEKVIIDLGRFLFMKELKQKGITIY